MRSVDISVRSDADPVGTRCPFAAFLDCPAARLLFAARPMQSCGVCLSRSVETNRHILKLFPPSGRLIILVFKRLTLR